MCSHGAYHEGRYACQMTNTVFVSIAKGSFLQAALSFYLRSAGEMPPSCEQSGPISESVGGGQVFGV